MRLQPRGVARKEAKEADRDINGTPGHIKDCRGRTKKDSAEVRSDAAVAAAIAFMEEGGNEEDAEVAAAVDASKAASN
jgi:hypothetical protein